jgi:hypothetical protein
MGLLQTLVEIEISVQTSVGWKVGLATGRAQEIECNVSLGHQEIPFSQGELGITGGETWAQMVLPCLNCSFGGVSSVHVWRDALEVDVVLFEGSLEFVGALIVEDVEFWCISVGL